MPDPRERDHITTGAPCWCGSRDVQPCPECEGEVDCWRCGGSGWVLPYDEDLPVLTIHRIDVEGLGCVPGGLWDE